MCKKLDVTQDWKRIQIGKLTPGHVEFLKIINADVEAPINADILFDKARIDHIETRHLKEFGSHENLQEAIANIPEIINNPDFIGLHPDGESINFIKKFECNVLVAVRLNNRGPLWIRSAYPITIEKLTKFLEKGRCVPVE